MWVRLVGLALAGVAVVCPTSASAHSWYPKRCCSDGDCRPATEVRRDSRGIWLTTIDNDTVLIGPADARLPSRDSRWHVCINKDPEAVPGPSIRCVFEPSNS